MITSHRYGEARSGYGHGHHGRRPRREVKAASLFEAVAQALKLTGRFVVDGFRPINVQVFERQKNYQVKLKDFMTWLDRLGHSPREVIDRKKISKMLGISRSSRL
jgi:hypothetical protein